MKIEKMKIEIELPHWLIVRILQTAEMDLYVNFRLADAMRDFDEAQKLKCLIRWYLELGVSNATSPIEIIEEIKEM